MVPAAQSSRGTPKTCPFPDNSFDAAVCGYGLMHVPDSEKVLGEMQRVVRPGGRIAVSVWGSKDPLNGFGLIYVAVRAHGNINVPLPHGADFFQFGTEEKMESALSSVGLTDVRATVFDQKWRVRTADQMLGAIFKGAVRSRAILAAQTEAEMRGVRVFFEKTLAELPKDGPDSLVPLPAIIGSGAKC